MGTFSESHFSNFNGEYEKNTSDILDFDNGSIIIHKENLKKYLDLHRCSNEIEFKDYMWMNHGVVVKVIY